MSEEYIFRYKLDTTSKKTPQYHHLLTELMRVMLEDTLNLVIPLEKGREVRIDSFRWLPDRENIYHIFPESNVTQDFEAQTGKRSEGYRSVINASFYEPRIAFIKRLIEQLLTTVDLEQNGEVVRMDGFRIKNLDDWLVSSPDEPGEIFEYCGSQCSCDCVFCCNKGNPSFLPVCYSPRQTAEQQFEEIKTRIKHFYPEAGKALFPSFGCVYEVMAHPYFIEVLRLLREKTKKPFRITTNGKHLTPQAIAELANLKPIYLYLSLNSSSPSRRRKLMRDDSPEIAINALSLLQQQEIPYAVVIVPWPVDTIDEMVDDLRATIAYAIQHEAHLIQINLPGYSKFFSTKELFDLDKIWKVITSQARRLREEYDYPIVVMPSMYEEIIYQEDTNAAQILGTVRNSPAHLAGLKRGDVIQQVNGIVIYNRPQARDLLSIIQHGDASKVTLVIKRNKEDFQVSLESPQYSYPYNRDTDTHQGVIFLGTGLRLADVAILEEIIRSYQAKRVLFLSSKLMKPILEGCLARMHFHCDSQTEFKIGVPENRFFGGNIFIGDLLVVADFIDYIERDVIERGSKPDLVIIPSSPFNLSGWGRDITGRTYLDIERGTGIPVVLLPCSTIYD